MRPVRITFRHDRKLYAGSNQIFNTTGGNGLFDGRGLSGTVAVVLLVAITVLLAAAVWGFVLSDATDEEEPVIATVGVDTTAEAVVITHDRGETIPPAELRLTLSGAAEGTVELDSTLDGPLTPGDRISIPTDAFDGVEEGEWLLGEFQADLIYVPSNARLVSEEGSIGIDRWNVDVDPDNASVLCDAGTDTFGLELTVTASTDGPVSGDITGMLDESNIEVTPDDSLVDGPTPGGNGDVVDLSIDDSVEIEVSFRGVSSEVHVPKDCATLELGFSDPLVFGDEETTSYSVEAVFDLQDNQTVTGDATVQSEDTGVVQVDDGDARIEAEGDGTANLTATYEDEGTGQELSTTETITVEDPVEAVSLGLDGSLDAVGDTTAYTVTAEFASGTAEDVTGEATVTAGDGTVIEVNGTELEAVAGGAAEATATFGAESDTVALTGIEDPIAGLDLGVDGADLGVGDTANYTVTAEFASGETEDVTNKAAVTAEDPIEVDEDATAVSAAEKGTGEVTAEFQNETATALVEIDAGDPVEMLSLTLDEDPEFVGNTTAYTVTAEFASGTAEDVTGEATVTSSDGTVIGVNGTEIEAVGEGSADVTAEFQGETDAVTVDVALAQVSIEDWHDLAGLQDELGSGFVLANDLDETTDGYDEHASASANGGNGWEPIGGAGEPFTGILNGSKHSISDLVIDRPDEEYVGLFADLAGEVTSLTVEGANLSADNRTGVIAGRLDGGLVEDAIVNGTVSAESSFAGGIAGAVGRIGSSDGGSGIVRDSVVDVGISAEDGVGFGIGGAVGLSQGEIAGVRTEGDVVGGQSVGGLVGFGDTGDGEIRNSSAHGAVEGDEVVGGLVGDNEQQIEDASATGAVTGDSEVGGAVGRNTGESVRVFATGAVEGDEAVGGLVGNNEQQIEDASATGAVTGDSEVGGVIGKNTGEATRIFAAGTVTGDEDVGGLVGVNSIPDPLGGELSDSYWDTNITGQDEPAGSNEDGDIENVSGLTTDEMQGGDATDSMDSFDFDETWKPVDKGYPALR